MTKHPRRGFQNPLQRRDVQLVGPPLTVVLATVQQARLAQFVVAIDDAVHGLPATSQRPRDLRLGYRPVGVQHDQVTGPGRRVVDALRHTQELGADVVMKYDPSRSLGHPFLSVATVGTDARFTMCRRYARFYLDL